MSNNGIDTDFEFTFLGLARDCEPFIRKFEAYIRQLNNENVRCRAFVGENGSVDGTKQAILDASARTHLRYVDTSDVGSLKGRLNRLAHARELVKASLRDDTKSEKWVVIVDLDEIATSLPTSAQLRVATQKLEEEAGLLGVSGMSRPHYYDLLALVRDDFSGEQLYEDLKNAQKNWVYYYFWIRRYIYSKQNEVTRQSAFYCRSAFNGICVYRSETYLTGSYVSSKESQVCEHITLNRSLHGSGPTSILVSNWVNLRTPTDHLQRGFFGFFIYKLRNVVASLKRRD